MNGHKTIGQVARIRMTTNRGVGGVTKGTTANGQSFKGRNSQRRSGIGIARMARVKKLGGRSRKQSQA